MISDRAWPTRAVRRQSRRLATLDNGGGNVPRAAYKSTEIGLFFGGKYL